MDRRARQGAARGAPIAKSAQRDAEPVRQTVAALQAGDFDRAVALARAHLTKVPTDAFAWEVLSLACYRQGQFDPGLEAAGQAIEIEPTAGRLANLGVLLRAAGREPEAETAYRRAIALDPRFTAAHHNLGNLLLDRGDLDGAEASFRHALHLNGDHAEAWRSLGLVLQRAGRMEEALGAFRNLLKRAPGHRKGMNDYAGCLMALDRLGEAETVYTELLAAHPDYADAHGNLGAVYIRGGRPFAAKAACERALALDPGQHRWMSNLAVTLKDLGRFDEAEAMFRRALEIRPDYAVGHGNLLFCLNYHPGRSAEEVFAEYRRWDEAHARPLAPAEPKFDNDRNPERRLRVGLVSPDFREHSARHFLEPMMAGLDRTRLEIIAYAEVARPDAVTEQFRALADEWRSTIGLSDEALAAMIRADRIDVLIDFGGHTASSRLQVFARRPAPVQIAHMLGCGYTSGLSAIDAFLADEHLAPPGSEPLFAERLVRLPRIPLAYVPPEGMPQPGPTPALVNGHVTFGYFGRPERINDAVVAAWSAILKGCPGSRLMLNAKAFQEPEFRVLFLERFAAQGIGAARLDLVFTTPQPRTWAAYGAIDIALDPFPHNAGTTTIEALWLGVPVLSIRDRPSVGRFGASILSAVGLENWVADDVQAYVARGIAAASDIAALDALRGGLRARFLASPLSDAAGLGLDLQSAIRDLWKTWCAGAPDERAAEAEKITIESDVARLQGRLPQAEALARRALALSPNHAGAEVHLGNALAAMGRLDEAEAAYGRALALKPDYAEASNNRGLSLMRRGLVGAAEHDLRRAMELRPDLPEIGFNLAAVLQDQGRLEEGLAAYQAAVAARPDISAGHGALLFCVNYQPQLSPQEAFNEFLRWDARHARPLTPGNPRFDNDPDPDRRLRIGYVSPDFAAKSGRHFIEPMLAGHDRRAVEVFAYAEVPNPDVVTAYFKTLADHWRSTVGMSDEQMAAMIRHDRIDILIDLGGHTARNRLLALARKPAPVQVAHFLGHGYTSGLTAMDAFLADAQLAPVGSEAMFSEAVQRLDRIPIAYQAPEGLPPVAPLPALRRGHVTFGHFGRTVRINELVVETWARILKAVPGSRLMLNSGPFMDPDVKARYEQRFAAHGVEAGRLDLIFTSPQPNTWAAYGAIDIGLDPFPHNAGTTTIESLWLGVPVVSLADRPSVGRFGLSILHAADLDDWVAADLDAYVARAVAAACDIPALAELRATLRTRMEASPLADGPGLAHQLERTYRDLWRTWCADRNLGPEILTARAAQAFQAKDFSAAARLFDRIARATDDAGSWSNLGASLRALDRGERAEAAYRAALAKDPSLANAHANLGNLLAQMGRADEAAACYAKALEIAPDHPGVPRAATPPPAEPAPPEPSTPAPPAGPDPRFGEALRAFGAGEPERALDLAAAILADGAGDGNVWHLRGLAAFRLGRLEAAEADVRRAADLLPGPEPSWNLIAILRARGELAAAEAVGRAAIEASPNAPEPLNNLGSVYQDLGDAARAEACFRRSLELRPENPEAWSNLAWTLNLLGKAQEGEAAARRALGLKADDPIALNNLGTALMHQDRIEEAADAFRQAVARRPSFEMAHSNLLFCLNYHPTMPAEAIFAEYQRWNAIHAQPLAPAQRPSFPQDDPNRRLRVGYVSPDFRGHAVSYFIEPLLAAHDRQAVELFCYSEVRNPDTATERFKALADHWRPTVGLSDEAMAELIRRDQIDVLVDLAGHTAGNRLLVFARRVAPVQIAHIVGLGYTSGLTEMDGFLADPSLAPPGAEALFSEPLIRLPRVPLVYAPPPGMPDVAPPPALERGHITFGCFSRTARLNQGVIELWAQILGAVPTARLVLNSKPFQEALTREVFAARFAALGVAPERLDLTYTFPQTATWAAYGGIDIALDPFPHNAGTTTIEALWLGVPVISLADRPSVGRFGRSFLTAVGLDDWAVDTPQAYLRKAVAAASDLEALTTLRAALRPRFEASPLRDAEGLARLLEGAYREAWLKGR